jgi:hypothetical protein
VAETSKSKTTTPEPKPNPDVELRLGFLAAIGLSVGTRYKSVYHKGNSMLGGVTLTTIVGLETPELTALVFQTDGVKDAPFQVVMLDALAAFTVAG